MNVVWWGRERRPPSTPLARPQRLVNGDFGPRPQLLAAQARDVNRMIRTRRPTFTADWFDPGADDPLVVDAGGALVELFSAQMSAVLTRLNQLPDKALVEFFRVADVRPAPARAAEAIVRFTVAASAARSTLVPEGFQLSASPADGSDDPIIFETQASLHATPADLSELYVQEGSVRRDVRAENAEPTQRYFAFGARPRVGNALLIGLGNETVASPEPHLSLGLAIAAPATTPAPASRGGLATAARAPAPVLRWEALVDGVFEAMGVRADDTAVLGRSGVVELRTPRRWQASTLEGTESPRYWLRLRLIHGQFSRPPELLFVAPNMVAVKAVRTIRDDVLEPLEETAQDLFRATVPTPGARTQMRLRNTPIVPDSLTIEIDTTPLDEGDNATMIWKERPELESARPDEQVFTLDPGAGVVTFGDGIAGAAIPPGFRNVRARSYQTGGGKAGAVDADQISTLVNAAPFVTGVTNPLPASGGTDRQSRIETIRQGANLIRSGQRAVTIADYALLARFTSGAEVVRAHAISGFHPSLRGQRIPGVVGVLVVPPIRGAGPPVPTEAELDAVARHLVEQAAPAGIEVVAASPRYRRLRTRVSFQPRRDADIGTTVRQLLSALNQYVHPLSGGADRQGWPFGSTLFFTDLIRQLFDQVADVIAIPRLRITIDGVPQELCANVSLGPDELFWPEAHEVFPDEAEDRS